MVCTSICLLASLLSGLRIFIIKKEGKEGNKNKHALRWFD